jgi:hypothetical protein
MQAGMRQALAGWWRGLLAVATAKDARRTARRFRAFEDLISASLRALTWTFSPTTKRIEQYGPHAQGWATVIPAVARGVGAGGAFIIGQSPDCSPP